MSLRTCFRICLMKKRFFIRQKANVELSENKSLRLNSSISESRFDMFPCLLPRNESLWLLFNSLLSDIHLRSRFQSTAACSRR